MDDKNLMENILQLEKGVCDLYLHGAIEAATPKVHQAFSTALNSALSMQELVFSKMSDKGWYPLEQAEQTKIDTVKQKFSTKAQ